MPAEQETAQLNPGDGFSRRASPPGSTVRGNGGRGARPLAETGPNQLEARPGPMRSLSASPRLQSYCPTVRASMNTYHDQNEDLIRAKI
jgi:hypothetical protein